MQEGSVAERVRVLFRCFWQSCKNESLDQSEGDVVMKLSPSEVGLALPLVWLGDGGDGLGVHTPLPDTKDDDVAALVRVEADCALCGKKVVGEPVFGSALGTLGSATPEIKGTTCPKCDAVYCNSIRHERKLGIRLLKKGAFGNCLKCGTSLENKGFLLPERMPPPPGGPPPPQFHPFTDEFQSVTVDGNDVVQFPQRCIICGSVELDAPVKIQRDQTSRVRVEFEQQMWGAKRIPIWRQNAIHFDVPHCRSHQPDGGTKIKSAVTTYLGVYSHIDGLQLGMQITEPCWRPLLLEGHFWPGGPIEGCKPDLHHPVWFLSFEFTDDSYALDFAEANQHLVDYFHQASRGYYEVKADPRKRTQPRTT